MNSVESGNQKLAFLLGDVEAGRIKIPQFQRDFVWDVEKAAGLIDSIIRGYPVGALIYWRTAERLREVRNLGRLKFPEAGRGEQVNYVLDGQQRLTSILAALNELNVVTRDGHTLDFSMIIVHLNPKDDESPIVRTDRPDEFDAICVPLSQLWSRRGDDYDACDGEVKDARDCLSDRLRTYDIPRVTLLDAELSVATEVFSRINTSGQDLTLFEIMVAKTYDPDQEFDLVEKFDEFKDELLDAHFDSIDSTVVLQLIALMLRDDCKKKTILDLERAEFIETWPEAIENLKSAVEYIKSAFRIPVSRLLPYPSLAIPIALFFQKNGRIPPNNVQANLLADFFWLSGWSERYSSATDSKLAQDKRTIESILNERPVRFDWAQPVSKERIREAGFSASKALSKTVLALFASLHPQKYNSGDLVNLHNDWLRRADSLNYHHVFPKSHLRKRDYEDWQANRLLNISLVDDFLNKRSIRARAPSDYMHEFASSNANFEATMRTHLIESQRVDGDAEASAAIWSDDYDRFIDERACAVVKLMKSRLIVR